jgi:transposase
VASDETTTRVKGATQWQWTFICDKAVLHAIAPRRAKAVAEEVMAGARPRVWISDRYAGQQDLAEQHQVCLAHVLRDVQYAIDCGDTVFAPKIRDHLRWCIRVGRRRHDLKDTTLRAYAARAEDRLDQGSGPTGALRSMPDTAPSPEPHASQATPRSKRSETSSTATSPSPEPNRQPRGQLR